MHQLQKDLEIKKEDHPLWSVVHLLNRGYLASGKPKKDAYATELGMDSIMCAIRRNVRFLTDVGSLEKLPPYLATSGNTKHLTLGTKGR